MSSVILYGDVSLNVIDGSSIWLVSMAEVLSTIYDEVHLQLKAGIENDRLLASVAGIEHITIHLPSPEFGGGELSPASAVSAVAALDSRVNADAIVVRGINACNEFCQNGRLAPRLWSYVTELPFPPAKISANNVNRISRIAERSRRMFAQTEAARSYLEHLVPAAAGKTVLLPPMLPDSIFTNEVDGDRSSDGPLRIVYSGKLAKGWKTDEMLELPRELRKLGIEAELAVVGAKFNRDPKDSSWLARMQQLISDYDADPDTGVKWLGSRTREESLSIIRQSDIGIGWRAIDLDSSLEISTKALEYMASGTPPLLNRTDDHADLVTSEYPLFVRGEMTPSEVARVIAEGLPELPKWRPHVRNSSRYYSMSAASLRLRQAFARAGAITEPGTGGSPARKTRVVIASHDMKFMGELMDHLQRSSSFEVKVDAWSTLHEHDPEESTRLLDWADTVFCEWAGPSLKWYSLNKNPGTRLVSRLHRFELGGRWMNEVNWLNVDQMVFVSDLYERMAIDQLPLEHTQTTVIPNAVDCQDFDRPKHPNARFTLGFVGMVPIHKRPDRALTLLESLLEHDDRYSLRFKGRMPWEYPYEWKKPVQKQLYLEFFDKISRNSKLRDRVVFDNFSPDIANWNRNIGFVLSPSEVESFHMAPAEGMAGRSVPIFWRRPGVDEIFGERFIPGDLETAVSWILEARNPEVFNTWGEEAREYVKRWDPSVLMPRWEEALANASAQ